MRDYPESRGAQTPAAENAASAGQGPADQAARRAFIAEWIERNQRRAAAGLGLAVLTLPMLASAQSEGYVGATSIEGVTTAVLGPDGALTITLANGQAILVPASQVQVVAGEVFISASAAQFVAEAAAVAAPAVGIGALAAGVAAVGLAAAVAASDSDGGDPAPRIVVDAVPGGGVLNIAASQQAQTITGSVQNAGEGATVVVTLLDGSGNAVLGPTGPLPVEDGPWSVTVTPEDIASVDLPDGGYTVTAVLLDASGEQVASVEVPLTVDLTAPEITISEPIAGDGVIDADEAAAGVTISGTTTGAVGREVSVTFGDKTYGTTVAADGSWSVTVPAADLAALEDGDFTVTAGVTDAAGNPATPAQAEVTLATEGEPVPSVSIGAIAGDNVIDADEAAEPITIAGTTANVEAGSTVTVTVAGPGVDSSLEATVGEDGSWSVEIDAPEADGESFTVTASVAGAEASATFTTQFTDPPVESAFAIGAVGDDGVVGTTAESFTVSGTSTGVAEGAEVTVTIGGATYTGNVAANGAWQVSVPGAALAGVAAGTAVALTASVVDVNGASLDASGSVAPHEAARTYLTEAARDGTVSTLAIEFDPRFELPGDGGFNLGETVAFNTAVLTYLDTPAPVFGQGLLGLPNTGDAANGSITLGGIGINVPATATPVTFSMNVENASQVARLDVVSDGGGDYTAFIGSGGADTIAATVLDTTIRGRGGNDQIDVSAGGVNTVLFEAAPAANGVDTVTGFSLGADTALPDRIGFAGLDQSSLRGGGTDVEIIAAGESIGANTGFVVFTTVFPAENDAPALQAFGALGLQAGDVVYALAALDDGDTVLARLEAGAGGSLPGDLDEIPVMARFVDVGDLTGFTADNVLGFTLAT